MTEEEYIESHIDAEPPRLRALRRHTHICRLYPRMCTDHVQGRLLATLTAMIRPHRILELGTFTGYSTLCMAEAMPEGCVIDTVELDTEYGDELRATFDADPRGADITIYFGDAEAVAPGLLEAHDYDMIFVDANKRRYPEYLTMILPRVASGTWILADNTLWDGKVCDPSAHDPQTEGIRRFNDAVVADPTLSVTILPIRDGLTLLRKL
ncbi:MAG: O-methyltransferase [Muribaculaceae bacterium]|nr:O-methyltransferase [Muribaculaceae bacterium]